MKIFLLLCLTTGFTAAFSQTQSYDIVSYSEPKGWKKEIKNTMVLYSTTAGNNWCQLVIYKSTSSKGSIEADSKSEWQKIVLSQHPGISDEKTEPVSAAGWQVISRSGSWQFNGAAVITLLTTYSNNNVCVSILCNTNAQSYLETFKSLVGSIDLKGNKITQPHIQPQIINTPSGKGNFKFTSTNWDDGWVTTTQDDWAEVRKASIRVLVHFPNKSADAYNSVLRNGLQNAWNILVAPRYTNVRNYELRPIQSFESISFAEADATEKATGRNVHIVLFKKHSSTGNGRYLEFITTDKRSFEQEFGAYHNDEFGWDKLSNMQNRNRFAIAATDLTGKWTASDYASLTYYYVNGGGFAGATATSISHEFTFMNNGTYQSDQAGASGAVGNQKFSRQVYKGNITVKGWELLLTNRFQGATEKYNCYFEGIKGGRILMLTDQQGSIIALVKKQ